MKIFLDDIRQSEDAALYMQPRIGVHNLLYITKEWLIVRNYKQFVKALNIFAGQITHISFDHDLGEDEAIEMVKKGISKRKARSTKKDIKSGYDCAKYFKEFYDSKELKYPILFVHSMNPIGTENIKNLFK